MSPIINGLMVTVRHIQFRRNDDGRGPTICGTHSYQFDSFIWQKYKPGS
jgi:hypothetical protein